MSTRSAIIAQTNQGDWIGIYCHFDGYLKGVGKTLFEHYNNQAVVEELMDLGDISQLGASIQSTVAYGRDKGEGGTEGHRGDLATVQECMKDCHNGFVYQWEGDNWTLNGMDLRAQLEEAGLLHAEPPQEHPGKAMCEKILKTYLQVVTERTEKAAAKDRLEWSIIVSETVVALEWVRSQK